MTESKYPKINTIWKRDEANRGRIIEGDFARLEFGIIQLWEITEKIDGTNVRVIFEHDKQEDFLENRTSEHWTVKFGGRTDDAQMSPKLLAVLQALFPIEKFTEVFWRDDVEEGEPNLPSKVVLYGEGYGAGIQKGGGLYCKTPSFILFDVNIDGWWLERDDVNDIARKLGIKSVPTYGLMDYYAVTEFVKSRPNSLIAEEPKEIEGIVARSYPLMLFRSGQPITWKMKVRDFK
jgi:hypothetical protein